MLANQNAILYLPLDVLVSFGLLTLAAISLWLPAPRVRGADTWLWAPLLATACASGLLTGHLHWQAPLSLALYAGVAVAARRAPPGWLRKLLLALTLVGPFLFAAHKFPGFNNPTLFRDIQFSSGAPAYSIRMRFDMAAVGIILMGVFCERIRHLEEWRAMLRRAAPAIALTLVCVLGLGLVVGYVQPDLKWTRYSILFLIINLFFVCLTEEAFFRGFLFAGLAKTLSTQRFGVAIAALASSLVFALAHVKGGPMLVVLAFVAGLLYTYTYHRTKRIEAAVLAHFALNAVHFVAFSYPYLTR